MRKAAAAQIGTLDRHDSTGVMSVLNNWAAALPLVQTFQHTLQHLAMRAAGLVRKKGNLDPDLSFAKRTTE